MWSAQKKCIEPLWESKSDYEIFTLFAERLGIKEEFTDGKTEMDWIKAFFDSSDLPKLISWEEFDRRAITSSISPMTTSQLPPCAGLPKAGPATPRTWAIPKRVD